MAIVRALAVLLAGLSNVVAAVDSTVQLPYATYQGQAVADGASQWLGIRYAKAPIGQLRYAAPQDPDTVSGVQQANKHGKVCLGLAAGNPSDSNDEDCLFLDVYAPTSATTTQKLPVFVFIQGGGFQTDANPNLPALGLLKASGNNIVIVTFNYRVGPYGFLAGKEVSSPNNGLKDQRKVLQWVQDNISKFGGDPNHVTLGGDSAGGASVTLHMTANNGAATNYFHAVAGESASFGPVLTVDESQYQYDILVQRLNCTSSSDTLACLRNKTAIETQAQNQRIAYPGQNGTALQTWNPVIDGTLIRDLTWRAFKNGNFVKVPAIFGADTNDGTLFADNCSETSQATSNNFIRKNFYSISDDQIAMLNQLYPNKPHDFPQCGAWWRQASDVYGEIRYMCPSLFLSDTLTRSGVPSYNYRYNVEDPDQIAAGKGVPHTIEVNAIFGPTSSPASYKAGAKNADIVPIIQAYWTSFIRGYDPNKFRSSSFPSTATWQTFNGTSMNRLQFASPPNATAMETVDSDQQTRCQYLWSIAEDLKQ